MATQLADAPALSLQGVTKTYRGDVRALDGVTFEVASGERCCLLGPNGAGKTTIIRLLQGAIRPDAGELRVLGATSSGAGLLAAKRRVGVVPQNPGMYPDLTVHQYLTFVRRLYGRGDVAATADACGVSIYLKRYTATLSGGLQRRLLIAAAVLSEPSVLLLDEPTVGLDPLAAAETRHLLHLMMAGRTVLMSTHNLAEAEELCDTVIIVRRGHVVVHERIDDLRRQTMPRVYLRSSRSPTEVAEGLATLGLPATLDGDSIWTQVDQPERRIPIILRDLLNRGIEIYECRLVAPTLEDLFVDLVTRQ